MFQKISIMLLVLYYAMFQKTDCHKVMYNPKSLHIIDWSPQASHTEHKGYTYHNYTLSTTSTLY